MWSENGVVHKNKNSLNTFVPNNKMHGKSSPSTFLDTKLFWSALRLQNQFFKFPLHWKNQIVRLSPPHNCLHSWWYVGFAEDLDKQSSSKRGFLTKCPVSGCLLTPLLSSDAAGPFTISPWKSLYMWAGTCLNWPLLLSGHCPLETDSRKAAQLKIRSLTEPKRLLRQQFTTTKLDHWLSQGKRLPY